VKAVFIDKDGTLVENVPYNVDPERITLRANALEAVEKLARRGYRVIVVSNQPGAALGFFKEKELDRIEARLRELLPAMDGFYYCPHLPDAGCGCRKPAAGLVLRAAARLGVDPAACAVVGDIGADVEAARAAGARGVLVPTPRTRREEVVAAPEVAPDLARAVDLLLEAPEPALVEVAA
jgi:histidinol-phosphate phosphatase family protein